MESVVLIVADNARQSPPQIAHSPELRLVVMMTLVSHDILE